MVFCVEHSGGMQSAAMAALLVEFAGLTVRRHGLSSPLVSRS